MGITALLVLGVSRREHSRPTRVGAESIVILALSAAAVGVLVTSGG
jgi:hypothetical protein